MNDAGIRMTPSPPFTNSGVTGSEVPIESFRPFDETGSKPIPPALSVCLAIFTPILLGVVIWYAVAAMVASSGGHKATSFCCAEGARRLTEVMNSSIDPCLNFTGYVCHSANRNRSTVEGLHRDLLENMLSGAGSTNWSSPTASTLTAFYGSCLAMPWSKEGIIRNLTSAIIERSGVRTAMTPSEILNFSLTMSLQYRLVATIYVVQKYTYDAPQNASTKLIITQKKPTITELYSRCTDCINLVLKQFNRELGCNVSEIDLVHVGNELRINQSEHPVNESGDFGVLGDVFESVTLVNWKEALAAAYIDLRDVDKVDVEDKVHLRHIMKILSNSLKQPSSIAFLVVYSVLSAYARFERELSSEANSSQELFCNQSVHRLSHTWEKLRSDISSDAGKSWEIHAIFDAVVKAISDMVMNGTLLATGDHLAAKALLRGLTLLFPHQYATDDNHPPNMTGLYLENHLTMIRYEQQLLHKKLKMHVFGSPVSRVLRLTLSGKSKILVPTSFYRDIELRPDSSVMHNLPWVGTNIANFVWNVLLSHPYWTKETQDSFLALRQCLRRLHPKPATVNMRSVAIVLSLKSLMNCVDRRSLYVPRTLEARWRLSHGQFFFMRMVDKSWCDRDHSELRSVKWAEMNSALDLTPEFGEAFRCPTSALARSCLG